MCIVETKNVTILFLPIRIFRKKSCGCLHAHQQPALWCWQRGLKGTVATNDWCIGFSEVNIHKGKKNNYVM